MGTKPCTNADDQMLYEIQIQGSISQRWLDWLGGMTILAVDEGEGRSRTTAALQVPDQAALLGQLQKLHNLGFGLLQIKRLA